MKGLLKEGCKKVSEGQGKGLEPNEGERKTRENSENKTQSRG